MKRIDISTLMIVDLLVCVIFNGLLVIILFIRSAQVSAADAQSAQTERDAAVHEARAMQEQVDPLRRENSKLRNKAEAAAQAAAQARSEADEATKIATDMVNLVGNYERITERLENEKHAAETRARKQKEEAQRLSGLLVEPIDVVVVIDVSASQEDEIKTLVETVSYIGDLLPEVAPEVRIGVIAYRETIVGTFELCSIGSGNGNSERLSQFLAGLKAVNGTADVASAHRAGRAMLDRHFLLDRRQVLCWIADVGPYELRNLEQRDTAEIVVERTLITETLNWARRSKERRFVSLYSGISTDRLHQETVAFAKELAKAGNGIYSDNAAELIKTLLMATLAEKGQD